MPSLKRKQTLFLVVARKAKEIRQNSTNLAFDNKTNARKGSKIATADARLAIYVFYLSMFRLVLGHTRQSKTRTTTSDDNQ